MDIEDLKQIHILVMKLLGISSQKISDMRGTSIESVSRHILLAMKGVAGESHTKEFRQLSERKNIVKHSSFRKIKNLKQAKNIINKALTTNSCDYSAILWFGNIVKGKGNELPPHERVFCPKDPSRNMSYQKPYAPRPDNKVNERLANMKLVLQLLNWDKQDISLFTNSLKLEQPLVEPDIDHHIESSYKLLKIAPQYPFTRKQKTKHLLISFAIKHLERDPSNFVYVQKFDVNEKELQGSDDNKKANESWWVYGHKDILDWFECY